MKWIAGMLLYTALLPTVPFVAPILSLFTKGKQAGFGGWYGTHDNPAAGDRGYQAKRAPFPGHTEGIKGYVNRAVWIIRNPLYGLKRRQAVDFKEGMAVTVTGNPHISDKYKVPGYLYAFASDSQGKRVAWEWYSVTPWSKKRCLRVRLGWKIKGDKFTTPGDYAPMVITVNPFDGYGDD